MEHDSGSESDASISKAWLERFGRCVPDGGAALGETQRQGEKPVKSSKRCGVIFDAASSQTSVPYPESKDEWESLINVLRLVTQVRRRLEGLKELGEIPAEEFHYLYSVIDNEVANLDKANAEAGFKACEETQPEVFRRKAFCESLAKEIEELEKAILNGEAAKKRLGVAPKEKEGAEELREQAQHERDKKRGLGLLPLLSGALQSSDRLVPRTWNGSDYACKCYVGDECWPGEGSWTELNSTVGGNLTTFEGPLGTVSTYDAAACAEATANFMSQQWTVEQPAALLWTYFTNDTCRPTQNPAGSCTLGYYGVYVIEAHTKEHVKAGVDFARENNLRLIIRNTGHDFIGRSTGWGALVINTHSFQDVEFTDQYTGPGGYAGGAVTIGAGVQGRALLAEAHAQDPPVQVMTGECPTVGVAGGLVQGGGHGPLTPLHGMVADTALSFEVVTASGEILTANSDENPDLFWALKGGGPGAFAVVLSVTLKTFPEQKSAGVIVNINSTLTQNETLFWEGVRSFHKYSNDFVGAGLYVYFELMAMRLHIQPFVGVGKTLAEVQDLLKPMFDELDAQGVPYDTAGKEFDTLWDLYIDLFEDEGAGASALTGGWMFSHQDVAENNDEIVEAFKTVISPREDLAYQGGIIGHLWDAGHSTPMSNSATHPRFRNATDFSIAILPVPVGASWEQKQDLQNVLTNVQDEAMRKAGPNGCAYVNEGDPFQPDWQDHFWGSEYPELLRIKNEWDPEGVFYTVSTPGTEDWEVIEYGTRLCRKV
ncbi:hypothetical protein DL769_009030 [Monosporascus sp. CRB-8-3]|nr:hypothetical protein DL769_009030 [Monosporascus sp. CRB-8-3]